MFNVLRKKDDQSMKKAYLKKYATSIKARNKNTPTYAQYAEDRESNPQYFKGITKPTYESQLNAAGINWDKDKPSARIRRKK